MKGRLIIHGPMSPAENMAIDEALARACNDGEDGFPALRLYWWNIPTLSLGAKELVSEAADLDACRQSNIAVVRRQTGGRAVLHDHELTYAIIGPINGKPFDRTVEESYRITAEALKNGISQLGIDLALTPGSIKIRPRTTLSHEISGNLSASIRHLPCFAAPSRYELTWKGRKVVGSAQRRLKNAVLQHGSILLTTDATVLAHASGSDPERVDELANTMIGLEEIANRSIERKELFEPLTRAFSKACEAELYPGDLSPHERSLTQELIPIVKAKISADLPDHG